MSLGGHHILKGVWGLVGGLWFAGKQTDVNGTATAANDRQQHESLPSRYSTNLSSGKLIFLLSQKKTHCLSLAKFTTITSKA